MIFVAWYSGATGNVRAFPGLGGQPIAQNLKTTPRGIPARSLATIRDMDNSVKTLEPPSPETEPTTSVKVSAETKATLDRLTVQLEADSLGDLIAFLIAHFETSTHLTRFSDLRGLQALADRLHTVLLLLATTNLEIGQQLRRIHAGHYRRLSQYADELLALHHRLTAAKNLATSSTQRVS